MKSEVFFFVTTIVIVVVSIFLIIVLVRLFKVLGDVKEISAKAKQETANIADDLQKVRVHAQTHGLRLVDIINFFKGFTQSKTSKKKTSKE